MTEDQAKLATVLLQKIQYSDALLRCLRYEREARETGLDPKAPAPARHIFDTLDDHWDLVGEKCVAFFIAVMDETIVEEERHLAELKRELEKL